MTYDFECVGCHHREEVVASIHDSVPEMQCPHDGSKMYRVFDNPGVIFNTDGFYKTGG